MGIKENRRNGKNAEDWISEIDSWFESKKHRKNSDRSGKLDFDVEDY